MTKIKSSHYKTKGSCYCGAISFEISDFSPEYTVCHCTECRKWTGSFYASISVDNANYNLEGADNITWHNQSPRVERGFCKTCGSTIFWRPSDPIKATYLDFAIGMLDEPDALTAKKHIYCRSKPKYYAFSDDDAPKLDD